MQTATMFQKAILVLGLIFSIFQNSLAGELERFDNLDGHTGYWLGLGLGSNYFGVTKSVNLSLALEQHIFSIRYAKSDEFQFNVEGQYDKPTIAMKEFALLYGRYFKKDKFALTFSAGISYLNGVYRGTRIEYNNFNPLRVSTIGLPLAFEFMIGFSESVGIGLHCSGNLNSDKIFGGANAKINIGLF